MTDNELRGKLLRHLYEKRRDDWTRIGTGQLDDPIGNDSGRIAEQLQQHGLIDFKMLNRHLGGMAQITAFGVDVVEGHRKPPISVTIGGSQTINVNNSSNFQIGDNNSQMISNGLHALINTIENSSGSIEEKAEVKSRLKSLLEHPLVSAVIGGGIGLLG